ncbi:MAG TPA: ABC transporter ATP-binding protein [Limnochordia bacterium]|nr:ABC transporter ATP-binding protein [Limnochordia bacterium]
MELLGVVVSDVIKGYAVGSRELRVLDGISLRCPPGEFVSLLGPSGAGKTTLLRLIAGLDRPDHGEVVYIDGSLRQVAPSRVRIGMVFQEPRLLPWASVAKNVSYGLQGRAKTMSRSEQERAVFDALELLGLRPFSSYLPHQISGGMAQRAALARALVGEPDLLLLDEPLGSLDIKNRLAIQDVLSQLAGARTCIMVTHSIEEAVYLSDRIYVLSDRPALVKSEIHVRLPRPRDRVAPGFSTYARQVIRALGVTPAR